MAVCHLLITQFFVCFVEQNKIDHHRLKSYMLIVFFFELLHSNSQYKHEE